MDLLPLLNFTGGFLSLKFEERTEDQWKQWKWSKTSETFVSALENSRITQMLPQKGKYYF